MSAVAVLGLFVTCLCVFFIAFDFDADDMVLRLALGRSYEWCTRQHIDALPCELLSAVEEKAMQYDCIGIDEGQFVRSFLLRLCPLRNAKSISVSVECKCRSVKSKHGCKDVVAY